MLPIINFFMVFMLTVQIAKFDPIESSSIARC